MFGKITSFVQGTTVNKFAILNRTPCILLNFLIPCWNWATLLIMYVTTVNCLAIIWLFILFYVEASSISGCVVSAVSYQMKHSVSVSKPTFRSTYIFALIFELLEIKCWIFWSYFKRQFVSAIFISVRTSICIKFTRPVNLLDEIPGHQVIETLFKSTKISRSFNKWTWWCVGKYPANNSKLYVVSTWWSP